MTTTSDGALRGTNQCVQSLSAPTPACECQEATAVISVGFRSVLEKMGVWGGDRRGQAMFLPQPGQERERKEKGTNNVLPWDFSPPSAGGATLYLERRATDGPCEYKLASVLQLGEAIHYVPIAPLWAARASAG